jgi:hypothetical protein
VVCAICSAEAVAAELAAHPADVVFMIHHETTAGIINPVSEIAAVLQKGEIFVVDSMSGFGGLPITLSRVDFMVSSANKCIPGVPGFAFALARKEALLATAGNARSVALDLLAQYEGFAKNGQFRFTPPTHALLAFSTALDEHTARGGVAAAFARFTENQSIITAGLALHGFATFIRPELQSPIITAFEYGAPTSSNPQPASKERSSLSNSPPQRSWLLAYPMVVLSPMPSSQGTQLPTSTLTSFTMRSRAMDLSSTPEKCQTVSAFGWATLVKSSRPTVRHLLAQLLQPHSRPVGSRRWALSPQRRRV